MDKRTRRPTHKPERRKYARKFTAPTFFKENRGNLPYKKPNYESLGIFVTALQESQ